MDGTIDERRQEREREDERRLVSMEMEEILWQMTDGAVIVAISYPSKANGPYWMKYKTMRVLDRLGRLTDRPWGHKIGQVYAKSRICNKIRARNQVDKKVGRRTQLGFLSLLWMHISGLIPKWQNENVAGSIKFVGGTTFGHPMWQHSHQVSCIWYRESLWFSFPAFFRTALETGLASSFNRVHHCSLLSPWLLLCKCLI